jgi:hypothetical protein
MASKAHIEQELVRPNSKVSSDQPLLFVLCKTSNFISICTRFIGIYFTVTLVFFLFVMLDVLQ